MDEKNCKKCLHAKVCKHTEDINLFLNDKKRRHAFRNTESHFSDVAKFCDDYLIYDKRSPEVFLQDIKSAESCFHWTISMCTNGDIASKKTLINQDEKWFDKDFVGTLRRGRLLLNKLIGIPTE